MFGRIATVGLLVAICWAVNPDFVDLHIGTGGHGFGIGSQLPGAQVPFGAARIGPDTSLGPLEIGWDHFGGYFYEDTHIVAFSHTHLVGAGVGDLGTIGLMPVTHVDETIIHKGGYRSRFHHSTEVARPGYYAVTAQTPDVRVELTAGGTMSGLHRYTFNRARKAMLVVLDVCHLVGGKKDGCGTADVRVDVATATVTGSVQVREALSRRSGLGGVMLFFAITFEDAAGRPAVESAGVWADGRLLDSTTTAAASVNGSLGAYVHLGESGGSDVRVARVGISFVNQSLAMLNREAQVGASSFDEVAAWCETVWADELSVLTLPEEDSAVTSAVKAAATALYHTLMAPTRYNEHGGAYVGFDNQQHVWDEAGDYYSDMSIWDIHRSESPWLVLTRPEVAGSIMRSLVRISEDGGDLPRWPLANVYTGCMVGSHAFVMLADAYSKGIRDFNLSAVYPTMLTEATEDRPRLGRTDLWDYINTGYVTVDNKTTSASLTLEYAFDDWALSLLADQVGDTASRDMLLRRSKNYRNVWDPESQFMCPRHQDGTFQCSKWAAAPVLADDHFVEGNQWQWLWFVPQDPFGLVNLFPSPEAFVSKLETFMSRSRLHPSNFMPNPYYWAGNEPDILAPWLFAFGGRPDRTQFWTRWIASHKYNTHPNGIPGNDDYGTLSAWLLFASAGFYPLAGSPLYMLTAPALPSLTVRRAQGDVRVLCHDFSEQNVYVSRVTLNGRDIHDPFLEHSDISGGASLEFWLQNEPSQWGRRFDFANAHPRIASLW